MRCMWMRLAKKATLRTPGLAAVLLRNGIAGLTG